MRLRTLLYLLALTYESVSARSCRCRPSDSCWPSDAEWQRLNATCNGNLRALRPIGAVCHGSEYDPVACNAAQNGQNSSVWRTAHPAAIEWPNWEAWSEKNQFCYIDTDKSIPCGQGRVSLYSILARSPEDIQAGVLFAQEHNLRVVIRNTGHDYAGRSVAPESLQINTHLMTSKTMHKNFKPTGSNGTGEGLAVTLGAGVQLYDMYKWLGEHEIMVVGGSSHGVGVTGGYVQGGGHSMFGPVRGMASDNALEFRIVTADGKQITANAYQNSDLFWALCGGGGGTWGVVTSVTIRAFPDPPFLSIALSGQAPSGSERYWETVEHFHSFLPRFNDAGGSMYYSLIPNDIDSALGPVSSLHATGGFANVSNKVAVDQLMQPFIKELSRISGTQFNYTSKVHRSASKMYTISHKEADLVGQNAIIGSRIITRDFLKSAKGPAKMTAALRSIRTYPGNTLLGKYAMQGYVVAGPAVRANAGRVDSALHPVWRKALVHFLVLRSWDNDATIEEQQTVQRNLTEVEVPILKALDPAPNGGAYLNEADGHEEGFQDSFWGPNYPRLYRLKQKWDPKNLFIVRRGVGSENWDAEGLCPK